MATAWFVIIAAMLTAYVVLDGFDFGAGILHLFVARTDAERRTVLAAIGPLWDGNEVWLVAAGGVLVFAFPRAYAAAFSGFYLPLMLALWLLVLRGVSIELRGHHESPLWRAFWDAVFAVSSIAIAVVLGASLGNVVRGVPIGADGYFHAPLFADPLPGGRAGALDAYTVLVGLFTLAALGAHGACYLRWKTTGAVQQRSALFAGRLWVAALVLGVGVTLATEAVRPEMFLAIGDRPAAWPLVALVPCSVGVIVHALRRGRELLAFMGSAALLTGVLGATAVGLYPTILRSTVAPAYDVEVGNASAGATGLRVGLTWWIPAIVLAVGYFTYLFWSFRGKVDRASHDH